MFITIMNTSTLQTMNNIIYEKMKAAIRQKQQLKKNQAEIVQLQREQKCATEKQLYDKQRVNACIAEIKLKLALPDDQLQNLVGEMHRMFVGNQCLHKQSYNGIGNSKEWVIPKSYGIVDKTNDRYLRERQVACVFVTKGYGMRVTREVLRSLNGTDLNNNEYNNLINGVVRSVYRKLQDFMRRQCGKDIRNLDRSDQKLLRAPLLNYLQWLSPVATEAFKKFVMQTYQIKQVHVKKQEAICLYTQTQIQLKKRHEEYELKHVPMQTIKRKKCIQQDVVKQRQLLLSHHKPTQNLLRPLTPKRPRGRPPKNNISSPVFQKEEYMHPKLQYDPYRI